MAKSEATAKDIKIKRSQPGSFIESLQDDIKNEGNRQPVIIELTNLNEENILDYIASLRSSNPRYQIVKNNCSHIVAQALIAGSDRKPSFTPHAEYYVKLGRVLGLGIWTPDQVLKFAKELKYI